MPQQIDEITNIRTGQRMIFLKSGKEMNETPLEIECFNPPSAVKEPEHYHPQQVSSCKVLSGILHFEVDGILKIVQAGETIVIPPGVPHYFWNEGVKEAHHLQRFSPALNIDTFFRTFFSLARDGKLNRKGFPNIFLISLIALRHQNEIRLVRPPWALQKPILSLFAPISRLLGYKSKYE